ncbi:MAG: YHS domain-containing protein, partial [Verrucomicrobia bacterium]|nr:YHS domain-containing protein [Verrucomicrobiota bacterium]
MKTDPICGMQVDETTALRAERNGETFYFCSEHCRAKFLAQPAAGDSHSGSGEHAHHHAEEHSCCAAKAELAGANHAHQGHSHHEEHSHTDAKPAAAAKYFCPMHPEVVSDKSGDCSKCGMTLEQNPAWVAPSAGKTIYTCPMHPEIEQDHPGDCPKCGMRLEPKTIAAEPHDDAGIRSLSLKFWIALVLTIPVLLIAMGDWLGLNLKAVLPGNVSRWIEFVLTTPVVLWAGSLFFARGWKSLVNRSLNMFTLIMVGVGAAYFYSAVAVLFPQIFPASFRQGGEVGLYFEAA